MAELTIHAVQWCAHHGHPVLALRTGDDRFFVVALAAADAAALSTIPATDESAQSSARKLALIEQLIPALGGRLGAVHFRVGGDGILRASLQISSPAGTCHVAAHFADAIVLGRRNRLALVISDDDLPRIPLQPLDPPQLAQHQPLLPETFRDLIESLDLTGLSATEVRVDHPESRA